MRKNLFPSIAWNNLKKNYRFFIPRILAETGLLAVFFIVFTLKSDERLLDIRGGDYISIVMSMGVAVMTILSTILMLYVNSFLMKQRTSEFGLYNILGMEKKHVGVVLFFENAISSLISILAGLFLGILFYKVCALLICKLLMSEVILGFDFLKFGNLTASVLFFVVIDLITFLRNLFSLARMKPVELLSSKAAGEKEPRVRWPILVIGVLSLGSGYFISVTTQSPLKAIFLFFVAVILVMIGTYALFTAGSIFVLKTLKTNKQYYYNPKHMTAVSGLLYRMKQNAVGLASICILATGVLVMISTTVSLYVGMQAAMEQNYPEDYYINTSYYYRDPVTDEYVTKEIPVEMVKATLEEVVTRHELSCEQILEQKYLGVSYNHVNGTLSTDKTSVDGSSTLSSLCAVTFVTEETYCKLGGEPLNLKAEELAVCPINLIGSFDDTTLQLAGTTYDVVKQLNTFPIASKMVSTVNCYGMVVADETVMDRIYQEQKQAYGLNASEYVTMLAVKFAKGADLMEAGPLVDEEVRVTLRSYVDEQIKSCGADNVSYYSTDSVWDARTSVLGMYGALLFLGILLGTVFLFATTLIIYYKQISEGYEDRERFQIMQKIGMSKAEVKRAINTQVLLVFFLPLVTAGIHLLFAFPILEKLLHILLLSSTTLFIICSLITYGVFALIYVLIYTGTARTYYKIVK